MMNTHKSDQDHYAGWTHEQMIQEVQVLRCRAELAENQNHELIMDVDKYRNRWEAAASCIKHNATKLKPRGDDEEAIIRISIAENSRFWSGKSKGWL